MKSLFALLLFCLAVSLSAQEMAITDFTQPSPPATNRLVPADRPLPTCAAGEAELIRHINGHLKYPRLAAEYGIEGTVVIAVSVAADGTASDPRIVRSLFVACDAAALSAVEELPLFLPAVERGRPVARTLTLPVRFSLR